MPVLNVLCLPCIVLKLVRNRVSVLLPDVFPPVALPVLPTLPARVLTCSVVSVPSALSRLMGLMLPMLTLLLTAPVMSPISPCRMRPAPLKTPLIRLPLPLVVLCCMKVVLNVSPVVVLLLSEERLRFAHAVTSLGPIGTSPPPRRASP